MKRKRITKTALIVSVVLMIAWGILGTSASLAWFTDVTPAAKNSFVVGQMNLDVYYKNDLLNDYAKLEEGSRVFNEYARYEPNYTQVVYLRIENQGNVDFRYKLSVDLVDYSDSTNVFFQNLHLPNYLRYGVVFGDSEEELNREIAQTYANREMEGLRLNQYSQIDEVVVEAGKARYAALIVYMPRSVGNEANHLTGVEAPRVYLGVTVFAQQADAPMPTE